jgi:hypothetical protein
VATRFVGLALRSAPDAVAATGSDTWRLLPPLEVSPRFGRRRLPADVRETQLPADENVIEIDRRAGVKGVFSGEALVVCGPSTLLPGSSSMSPGTAASMAGAGLEEIMLGFTRWGLCR